MSLLHFFNVLKGLFAHICSQPYVFATLSLHYSFSLRLYAAIAPLVIYLSILLICIKQYIKLSVISETLSNKDGRPNK